MYTQQDYDKLDREYFDVIGLTGNHIIVKSKNTGHSWDIHCSEWSFGREIRVSHKHNDNDYFHDQQRMHPKSIEMAQKYIKDHDEWYCKHRKRHKKRGRA